MGQGNYSFPISWAVHRVQPKVPPFTYWADGFSPADFHFRLAPEGRDSAVTLAGKMLPPSSGCDEWLMVHNTCSKWPWVGIGSSEVPPNPYHSVSRFGYAAGISRHTTNAPISPHWKPEPALDSWGSPLSYRHRRRLALLTNLTVWLVPGDGSWRNHPGIFPYLGSI